MGEWRADQSKEVRRYLWGQTRGEKDETRRDFLARIKAFPELAALRTEKVGSELHLWRELKEETSGKTYWTSCIRFVDDRWGYWTVLFRDDERRWRSTPHKELPLRLAIEGAAEVLRSRLLK
jgi:hypothetical protein